MEPTYLSDYIRLAFQLGHLSASLGEVWQDEPGIIEEWQGDIDALAERMESLGLPQSKQQIISFLEQVGDLMQQEDGSVLEILAEEAETNLEEVLNGIRRDAQELRSNPETLPKSVRELLTPRLLDALPEHAKSEYEEAKMNLLAGTWTSAVRSACVAVEATLGKLYQLYTGNTAEGKSWEEMQKELYGQPKLDGKHPGYIVAQARDIQLNYRNRIAHPDLRFTDDVDAYAAFYHCVVTLRRMSEAILTKTMPIS